MLVLSNGEKYIGEFDDGMIHGDGEFTTFQNEVIKGIWDQGYLVQMNEEWLIWSVFFINCKYLIKCIVPEFKCYINFVVVS